MKFYDNFLDRYFDRRDFELIEMDTDNNYIAIRGQSRLLFQKERMACMGQVKGSYTRAIQVEM